MTRIQSTKHLRLAPLSHVVVMVDIDDAELSPRHLAAMEALRDVVAELEASEPRSEAPGLLPGPTTPAVPSEAPQQRRCGEERPRLARARSDPGTP